MHDLGLEEKPIMRPKFELKLIATFHDNDSFRVHFSDGTVKGVVGPSPLLLIARPVDGDRTSLER